VALLFEEEVLGEQGASKRNPFFLDFKAAARRMEAVAMGLELNSVVAQLPLWMLKARPRV